MFIILIENKILKNIYYIYKMEASDEIKKILETIKANNPTQDPSVFELIYNKQEQQKLYEEHVKYIEELNKKNIPESAPESIVESAPESVLA